MFEQDEATGAWAARHHPFTAPKDGHEELFATDPANALAKAYDVVLNGWEIGGGSVRIHRPDVQAQRIRVARDQRRGPAAQVRLPARRAAIRRAAARRHRVRPRSDRDDDGGRGLDPRRHRVPEDAARPGPADRHARARRPSSNCATCTSACARRTRSRLPADAARGLRTVRTPPHGLVTRYTCRMNRALPSSRGWVAVVALLGFALVAASSANARENAADRSEIARREASGRSARRPAADSRGRALSAIERDGVTFGNRERLLPAQRARLLSRVHGDDTRGEESRRAPHHLRRFAAHAGRMLLHRRSLRIVSKDPRMKLPDLTRLR